MCCIQAEAARLVPAVPVPRDPHAAEHRQRGADVGADGAQGDGGRDRGRAQRSGRRDGRAARGGRCGSTAGCLLQSNI